MKKAFSPLPSLAVALTAGAKGPNGRYSRKGQNEPHRRGLRQNLRSWRFAAHNGSNGSRGSCSLDLFLTSSRNKSKLRCTARFLTEPDVQIPIFCSATAAEAPHCDTGTEESWVSLCQYAIGGDAFVRAWEELGMRIPTATVHRVHPRYYMHTHLFIHLSSAYHRQAFLLSALSDSLSPFILVRKLK